MGRGAYAPPRRGQASAPDARGHGPSGRRTLAPKRWSPASAGWQGREDGCAPLRRASRPLVRALVLSPSGPSHAAMLRPRATPAALLHRQGLGSARATAGWGVPRPRLAAACHAAAGPNPRRGLLVLGFPASLIRWPASAAS